MKIFLVGYMASGKSTLGKRLARQLGLTFRDLDHEIEGNLQTTIPEIFTKEGEEGFREIEKRELHRLLQEDDYLLSTGGGTPCFYDNLEVMKKAGVVVFLEVSPTAIVHRLMNAKTVRPLVAGKSKEELNQFVESHLSERLPHYQQAHLTIRGGALSADEMSQTVREIRQCSEAITNQG